MIVAPAERPGQEAMMAFTRRALLIGGTAAAAGVLTPIITAQKDRAAKTPSTDLKNWEMVRAQFSVDPSLVHTALFYLASNPRPVREAIESHRRALDTDPLHAVEHGMFGPLEGNLNLRATRSIADYIGARAEDIALTQNTTSGLAILYQGLPLRPNDEILTTDHDHFVHHESIRLAAERAGASWRKIPLFDSIDSISRGEIVERIRKAIRPNTRAVGVTWVHSSTGVRLPLAEIAAAMTAVNASRTAADRVLLFVDGVHGLGVEERLVAQSGIDAFSAGTHKWIFGPRGTGFVWAREQVWAQMRPMIPSFSTFDTYQAWIVGKPPARPPSAAWFTPGGFWAFEHYWAVPAAFDFHRAIGPERITTRIHELNGAFRAGLESMSHVRRRTPRAAELTSGIVTFEVDGMNEREVVARLLEKNIVASTTPYANSYARVAFGIQNNEDDVETTLRAIRALKA